jgi:hypothetical protein
MRIKTTIKILMHPFIDACFSKNGFVIGRATISPLIRCTAAGAMTICLPVQVQTKKSRFIIISISYLNLRRDISAGIIHTPEKQLKLDSMFELEPNARITIYASLRAARNPPPTCAHATEREAQEDNYKNKGAGCSTNDTPGLYGRLAGATSSASPHPWYIKCTCAGS